MLHYVDVNKNTSQSTIQFVVLCVRSHLEEESSEAIGKALDQKLQDMYCVSFWSFMKRMTLVTDCVGNMLRILNASFSTSLVPLSEWEMGCFAHQLNTAIKHVLHNLTKQEDLSVIAKYISLVKKVVTAAKPRTQHQQGKNLGLYVTADSIERRIRRSVSCPQRLCSVFCTYLTCADSNGGK